MMLCRISDPIRPRPRLAPTTATALGSKNGFIDAVAASCDRSAIRAPWRSVAFSDVAEDPHHAVVVRANIPVESADLVIASERHVIHASLQAPIDFEARPRPAPRAGASRRHAPGGHRRWQTRLLPDAASWVSNIRGNPGQPTARFGNEHELVLVVGVGEPSHFSVD
jgi:hypothetical protein